MSAPFFHSCVSWPPDYLDVLLLLQDEEDDITLDDLRSRVNIEDLDRIIGELGYAQGDAEGLRIEDDYHVSYHIHRDSGIAFMRHSAIEYVFTTPEKIEELYDAILERAEDDIEP